ncbi:hypothetical protein H4582DRAFT_623109 [Lactarius indigo]|nr:hypothetical protein H4582DRAFT_623109 [Lactarius indigo]
MSTLPVIPHIEDIAAPRILGNLWNWTLYGVLVVQLYVYSYNFPKDRALLKLLVYALFLVETLQTALSGADLYYWFVSGFGNMNHLTSPYVSPFAVPIIGSIVSITVQLFFVYRVWVLSGRSSRFLCLIITLCSAVAAATAFTAGVYTHIVNKLASRNQTLRVLTLTWVSGNALADILIAGSMLFYLRRRRREGDGYLSDHAITRVVRLTVETNVLTSTVGIIALLTVAVFPDTTWFTCPLALLGKLYSNTLLVSLNNRISIREGRGAVAKSPVVTFALTLDPQPVLEIVRVESKELSASLVAGSLEDGVGQDASRAFVIA